MEKKARFGQMYPVFVSTLPLLGIVEYLRYYYDWGINEVVLGVAILVLIVIVHGCYLLRKQPLFYILFSIVLLAVAIVIVNEKDILIQDQVQRDYLIRTGMIIILAIVCYVITRIYYGKIALSLFFLGFMVRIGVNEQMVSKLSVVSCTLFCILVLGETMVTRSLRKRGKQDQHVLVSLLPIYIIVFILLLILPVSKNRFEWSMVRNVVEKAGDSMEQFLQSFQGSSNTLYDYEIAMTGYSEDGSVGGGVVDRNQTVLTIDSKQKLLESLYLSGNTKNIYKGNEWTDQTSLEYKTWQHTEQQLALWELIYSMYRYNGVKKCTTYLNQYDLTITYEDLTTASIFHTTWMESMNLNDLVKDSSRTCNLVFQEEQSKDTSYGFTSYRLNYGLDQVRTFLMEEQNYSYKIGDIDQKPLIESLNEQQYFRYQPITASLESELYNRKQWIDQNYLEVSSEVPDRVGKLTKEITQKYDTTYEKLLAIEQYLHQYTYKKSVKQVPEGRDLVDYFLFDSKEGYCTYFATAMAVMARTIGIPTRYVQGFLVDAGEDTSTKIEVNSMDAHAWVEAYIEGVGWIAFEPTAGYEQNKYEVATVNQIVATPAPIIESETQQDSFYSGSLSFVWNTTRWIAGVIVILFVVSVIFLVIRAQNKRRRYHKMSNTDRLLYLASKQMLLLEVLGYKRSIEETWSSFTKRIETEQPEFALSKEEELFLRVRYHKEQITEQDLACFIEQNALIMQRIKHVCSKRTYLVLWIRGMFQ